MPKMSVQLGIIRNKSHLAFCKNRDSLNVLSFPRWSLVVAFRVNFLLGFWSWSIREEEEEEDVFKDCSVVF